MRNVSLLCIVLLGVSGMLAQAEPAAPASVTEFSLNSANAQNGDLGTVAPKQVRPGTFVRLHPEALKGGSRQGGDDCAGAYPIGALPFSDTGTTTGYRDDYDEACPYTGSTSADVVYSFIPAADIYLDVDLCESGYDTKTYIYEDDCISANMIACNDDDNDHCTPGAYRSYIAGASLTAGHTYYIVIDGYGGADGEYTLLVTEGDTPPPLPECPEGSLFAQEPVLPDGSWSLGNAELPSYQRFDEYAVEGLICDLHWWGAPLFYNGTSWVSCDENPMGFVINFYADDAGAPAATPTCTYEVTVPGVATGQLYSGFEAYSYELILDPCCALESGWLSIQGAGDPDCWFLWNNSLDSPDGNNSSLFYISGAPEPAEPYDLAFCLTGQGDVGACCDDVTGECVDGVLYTDCAGRWAEGLCADLDPACGDATGACCYPDGCEILTAAECAGGPELCPGDMDCSGLVDFDDIDIFVEALGYPGGVGWPYDCPWLNGDCNGDGDVTFDDIDAFVARIGQPCDPGARDAGVWLGPGTTCDMCPCVLECPPGAVTETEACGDDTNGGCNMETPAFEPITCSSPGNTVCGTAWALDGSRDTDWYELILDDCYEVTVTLASEFSAAFGMIEQNALGVPGCDNITGYIDPFGTSADCTEASITTICLPPGTYYIFVGPAAFDGVSCELGADYYLTVSCQSCPCCDVTCAGTPEGEPVCEDDYVDVTNGGCNSEPPVFGEIVCDETICGTAGTYVVDPQGAAENHRDTDWFKFVGDAPGAPDNGYIFTWTVEAEFEASIFVVVSTSGCDTIEILNYASGARCTPISVTTGCLPIEAGLEYYFLVMPSNFVGVPCGAEYAASLSCTPCSVCTITPADPAFDEGEACGATEGDPGENGGCNNTVPTFTTFPSPWGDVGTTTWVNGTGFADDGTRDTDWYTVTLTESAQLSWQAQAEFPALVGIIYPSEMGVVDCEHYIGMIDGWAATGDACEPNVGVSVIVPAGDYMLFIAPADFEGSPCGFAGNHYKASVTVTAHDYHDCEVSNSLGLPDENEPACTDNYVDATNGGCDFTPNNFLTIGAYPNDGYYGRVGTFTGGLGRDTDWYEITLDDWYEFTMNYLGEFDMSLDLYDASLGCEGAPIATYYGPMCAEQSDATPCLAPGTYWIKIYPATTHPDAIPCDTATFGQYWLFIDEATFVECNLDCVTGTCTNENEDCGADPNVNDGCLGSVFDPFVLNDWYCGTLDVRETETGRSRDFDFWMYSEGPFAADTPITLQWRAEIPAKPVILTEGCDGPWWHLLATQGTCEDLSYSETIVAGADFVILFLITGDENNDTGYGWPPDNGTFPCGDGLNDYRFRVTEGSAAPVQTKEQATSSARPASIPDRFVP